MKILKKYILLLLVIGFIFVLLFFKQDTFGQALRVFTIPQGGTGTSTAPSSGYMLIGNASGTYDYVASSTLGGVGGSGLTNLNGQTGSIQTFATSTATGIGLNINSTGDTHTFTPTISSDYAIPLSASSSEWTLAYGWGNHAIQGYLTTVDISANTNLGVTATGLQLTGDNITLTSGYTIPFSASTTNWQTAYSWGNHALAGYLSTTTGNWLGTWQSYNPVDFLVSSTDYLSSSDIGSTVQAYDADLTTWAGITPGANVGTALGVAVGSAGAFLTFNGALGTPSSGTVTNLTGTASININGTVGATTPSTGVFTSVTTSVNINGSYLTASEILITDASKNIVSAPVATYPSLTELSYVKGLSSAVQTQINGKQATLTNPVTGTGTINELAYWTSGSAIGTLAVATYPSLTELAFLKGVTSAIQTQINSKASSTAPTFATSITGSYLTASEMLITNSSKNIISAPVATYPSLTELTYLKGVTSGIQTQFANYLALAGGTMTGSITLGENTSIALDPAGSADGKYSGTTITGTGGATIAFGRSVYLKASDSQWYETDADATSTAGAVMVGMTVTATTDNNPVTILLNGTIRADASFPTLTTSTPVYLGETAGDVQVALPTGTDNVVRIMGFALNNNEIYFNPSPDHLTLN